MLDFSEFASAADKAEHDLGIAGKARGCLKNSVEGVAGAMIARIHDHEFVIEVVLGAETATTDGVEANFG